MIRWSQLSHNSCISCEASPAESVAVLPHSSAYMQRRQLMAILRSSIIDCLKRSDAILKIMSSTVHTTGALFFSSVGPFLFPSEYESERKGSRLCTLCYECLTAHGEHPSNQIRWTLLPGADGALPPKFCLHVPQCALLSFCSSRTTMEDVRKGPLVQSL